MIHSMKKFFLIIGLLCGLTTMAAEHRLLSPDGRLALSVYTDNGQPTYTLSFDQTPVVLPSHLGLQLRGEKGRMAFGTNEFDNNTDKGHSLMAGFEMDEEVQRTSFDETWATVWGEEREIRNHYNEMVVTFRQRAADILLRVRAELVEIRSKI